MSGNRIQTVASAINFIEAHLADRLDLTTVADAVHYSKYHLHRTFTKTVGITVHDYIQRRKLTEAAKLLVFSGKPILDVALLAGYGSQQAFTDVFTAMYKQSPHQYRANEKFYPLQLRFEFRGDYKMLDQKEPGPWDIALASEQDIACWMELVRLVVDGFPHLNEEQYIETLRQRIRTKQALILKDGKTAAGAMLFSYATGSIDFMGTHPLYRQKGVPRAFIKKMLEECMHKQAISITTYREGDAADTGYRREIMELGFAEAELLVEFGYPTQRFILPQEDNHEE